MHTMKRTVCLCKFKALLIPIKPKVLLLSVLSSKDELLTMMTMLALIFLVYPQQRNAQIKILHINVSQIWEHFVNSPTGTVPCQITVLVSEGRKITCWAASLLRPIPCPCLECSIVLSQLTAEFCAQYASPDSHDVCCLCNTDRELVEFGKKNS